MNTCSKPGCARAGAAVLGYDYSARLALLADPPVAGGVPPHLYVLCVACAERLRPPQGWILEDTRTTPPLFVAGSRPVAVTLDDDDAQDRPEPDRRQLFFGCSA